ncbi:MAG: polysaccharide biosynthesis tyrosine autokinase [Actinobacteria bacterium]|nr:polysaccharide biosynthesis tyrosine autokinase [Actinomycetota bacterium]
MELKDYIDIVFNRKWILVGTVVVLLASVLVFTLIQSPVYESSVKILADINSTSDALLSDLIPSVSTDTEAFVENQVEIVKTKVLAKAVVKQLKYNAEKEAREENKSGNTADTVSIPDITELQEMVSVRLGNSPGVFEIVVTGSDPELTRDVANTYAEVYISNRQLAAVEQISEARDEIWNRILEVEEELQKIAQESKQYKSGEVPAELIAAAQQSAALWASLYEKYMSLRVTEALGQRGLEVIEPAESGKKVGPKPVRNGVLAVIFGIIFGLIFVFFIEYTDDTLRTRGDFERYYDTVVVGEIPAVKDDILPENHIIYYERPNDMSVEGYRILRTNLKFLNLESGRGSILFTSALPGEGKSTVMVNLGAALAETGKKVLLVEADLRKPMLIKFFGIPSGAGLSNVLARSCEMKDAILSTKYNNLFIAPVGVRPPNPGELAASEMMANVIEEAKGLVDYVLVDAPPVLAANDALALADMVDGVLLVGSYEQIDRESAKRTVDLLRKVKANILGLVINNLEAGRRYTYYHYYYEPLPDAKAGGRFSFSARRSKKNRGPTQG